MNFIIIIPARFCSFRFPGKLLADIHGKPMIVRVIEKALTTKAKKIIVATDNVLVIEAIKSEYNCCNNKILVCLTKTTHQSGTERVSEVIKRYNISDDQNIVQLQADEPLITSNMIHQVIKSLHMYTNKVSVTTLATVISSEEEFKDKNVVKIAINIHNDALYFSRSQIPWHENKFNCLHSFTNLLLRHIGIYSYKANFIRRYMQWIKSPLEQLENLEQLRTLWYGEKINVSVISGEFNISVDTPESLKRVNKLFLK